jgi:hypothetical protein
MWTMGERLQHFLARLRTFSERWTLFASSFCPNSTLGKVVFILLLVP